MSCGGFGIFSLGTPCESEVLMHNAFISIAMQSLDEQLVSYKCLQ